MKDSIKVKIDGINTIINTSDVSIGDNVICLSFDKTAHYNHIIDNGKVIELYIYEGIYYSTLEIYKQERAILDNGRDCLVSQLIIK